MWLKPSRNRHKKWQEMPDDALLHEFQQTGALQALSILYNRYLVQVTGLCLKYLNDQELAKDAVMQIFEELTEKVPQHQIQHFKSWLYVFARNHCLMYLRKEKKNPEKASLEDQVVEKGEFVHPLFEENIDREAQVKTALESLSPEQKQCVELFFFEEKSYQEIEQLTGFPLKKVKSYLQNGKRNLRNWFEKNTVNE